MELGVFWSNSDQFLINSGANLADSEILSNFSRFLQISTDFCTFWLILAGLRRPRGHGLGRPLPREAAPSKRQGKPMIFRCFARCRPCPPGSARRPSPRSAVDFCAKSADSCRFQHISACFCIFLSGNSLDFGSFLVIFVKFLEFHHFDHFWWIN